MHILRRVLSQKGSLAKYLWETLSCTHTNIIDIFALGVPCHREHPQKKLSVYFGPRVMGFGFCNLCWGTVLPEDTQPLGQLHRGALFQAVF